MRRLLFALFILILSAPAAIHAQACVPPAGSIDINCDGVSSVVVVGDSLVAGFGDSKSGSSSGYVGRAAERLHKIHFTNYGILGLKTTSLLAELRATFKGRGQHYEPETFEKADIVILDLGRNDRWSFGPATATFSKLRAAASLIKSSVAKSTGGLSPVVVTAVLMYPNRGSQGPWVAELDKLIIKSNKLNTPANLRFDKVSKRLLSADQIHPTPAGYSALAKVLIKYVSTTLPKLIAKIVGTAI